jgi:hypothetical protein
MLSGLLALWLAGVAGGAGQNLLPDGSFEQPKPKDRWGLVFAKWGGWMYEGECEFRVSGIAHSGRHSLLIVGKNNENRGQSAIVQSLRAWGWSNVHEVRRPHDHPEVEISVVWLDRP